MGKTLIETLYDIIDAEELEQRIREREEMVNRNIDDKGVKKPAETNYDFWGVEGLTEGEGAERGLYGRDDVLNAARKLINGDRAKDYGDAAENFGRIAVGWSELLDVDISADQVALCMAWLKMCRLITSPRHTDSYVDCAGYIALAGEIAGIE